MGPGQCVLLPCENTRVSVSQPRDRLMQRVAIKTHSDPSHTLENTICFVYKDLLPNQTNVLYHIVDWLNGSYCNQPDRSDITKTKRDQGQPGAARVCSDWSSQKAYIVIPINRLKRSSNIILLASLRKSQSEESQPMLGFV